MYSFLLDENNKIITTHKASIMQKSSLVDNIQFKMFRQYKGQDMAEFKTVYMEYILPVSKSYHMLKLEVSEMDDECITYVVNGSTDFTAEAGEVEFSISFYKLYLDENNKIKQFVRKLTGGSLHICPIRIWSDMIPDDVLTPLDQRIIALEAMAIQYYDISEKYNELLSKQQASVANVNVSDNNLHLEDSTGNQVGAGVGIQDLSVLIKQAMVGIDADGVEDGNVELDNIVNNI